jgi:hypothetical protein
MRWTVVLAAIVAVSHALSVPKHADSAYPVGSTFTETTPALSSAAGVVADTAARRLDIANNNLNGPHPVLLNPIAVNIYYGAAWTKAQRDLIDFFTANLGSTPYMTTLQSLKDPSGATISPLKFGGSFFDPVPDSKTVFGGGSDAALLKQVQGILQGYVDAKSIGGTPFDVRSIDQKNTIINIITSPQVRYLRTGSCGYHSSTSLSSDKTDSLTINDIKVVYSVNAASLCSNPFTSTDVSSNGQGGNAIISKTPPNNDAVVDGVVGILTHEVATFSSIWYLHFSLIFHLRLFRIFPLHNVPFSDF